MATTLTELNPVEGVGQGDNPVPMTAMDPTAWDANNLLGRYHVWRIASQYPIPGSAVLNDYRRVERAPTEQRKDAEAAAVRAAFEQREEVKG